ncbi:hypothetical protein ACG7TL_005917 [Trametes sanguinea]
MAAQGSSKVRKLGKVWATALKAKDKRAVQTREGPRRKVIHTTNHRKSAKSTGIRAQQAMDNRMREEDMSKEELEAELMNSMQCAGRAAKLADRRKERDAPTDRIPKLRGTAGNDYNLCRAMGLDNDPELYETIRTDVRDIVHQAGLDYSLVWHKQPISVISRIFDLARECHPILQRYAHDWATADLVKGNLRWTRYYRKSGRNKLKEKRLRAKGGDDRDTGQELLDNQGEQEEADMDDQSRERDAADADQSEQDSP